MPDPWDVVSTKPVQQGDEWAVKGTRPAPAEAPAQDRRDQFTNITPHGTASQGTAAEFLANPSLPTFLKGAAQETGTALSNIGAGGLGMILHPADTLTSILRTTPPGQLYDAVRGKPTAEQEMGQSFAEHPLETAEQGVGQAAVAEAAGEVGPITRALQDKVTAARGKLAEAATGTGPKTTAELVKNTQAENAKGEAAHGEKLQKNQAEVQSTRKENVNALNDHLAKIDEISQGNQDAKATATLRKQLPKIIDDTAEDVDVRIEKARHDALEEGNNKYNTVNPKLNPIEADPEFLPDALVDASESIKGSNTSVPILKDIETKIKRGDVATYEDLQGYYSELGKEISKGNLPGDVYHALDTLHESMGKEMQRIANSKGKRVAGAPKIKGEDGQLEPAYTTNLGKQLYESREYWRRMKQTFGDTSDAVSDRAGKELATTHGELPKSQMSEYRRRLLGSFDPQIPRMLDSIDEGKARLEGLPKETQATPYPAPPTPKPLPETPTFEPQKLGTEDVRAAKEEGVRKTTDYLRKRALTVATFVTGYKALAAVSRALAGDPSALGSLPGDVAEGVGVLAGFHGMANFLESPKILKLLTEPTARDLAEIPPEMRGDLKPIIEKAQSQGIKVDPRLVALAGAVSTPKGPATRKLEELRNGQSQPTQ